MRRLFPFALAGTALVLLAAVALPTVPVGHVSDLFKETRTGRYQVLVFSKTTGFRHNSIPSGIAMIERLAQNNDFDVVASEDATLFNDDDLAEFEAVIFLSTTGNILNDEQQDAFERYIQGGGGFAGIHAATDTEYDWPWYGELVGTYFESHPPGTPTATIKVADQVHPSTAHLPKEWERTDEWYNFRENPRGKVHVLMTLDEDTYSGGTDGHDHPIAWCRPFNGGRSWYTGGGHTSASFSEPDFERHVLGGIEYAAGFNDGDCSATLSESYEVKVLEDDLGNPMMMDIASDGRIFIAERRGQVRIHTPSTGITETVGTVDVYSEQENGLLGLALDPNFDDTQWIYLFYSPPGSRAVQNVSRFTMNGDMLDLGSEELILEIENQREECCHSGGALYFHDATGELYIATGDDTNPFTSSGFGPMDERPGRAAWDAQRTSGNTQDLRGKIMRIKPEPEGGYSIPEGNLFTDPAEGRPEIYAMGSRNPFRISVDQERGWLYWGEVGPDAQQNSSTRGPRGYDEWNQARSAGNYGWPYCLADNKSYRDFDFGEERSGSTFDCANLVNDSPNNTGAAQLPPARPAMVWYPYAQSDEFPVLGTGARTAMAGPVYYHDAELDSKTQLPAYFDDTVFIYEWSRNWIKELKLNDDGEVLVINDFLPDLLDMNRPMDIKVGPDGALYVLEWGSGFGGNNDDAQLIKIEYRQGTRSPIAIANASVMSGPVPLTVEFSSEGTFDPDTGDEITIGWDFNGDGTLDSMDPNPAHTYTAEGDYNAVLVVTDQDGNEARSSIAIVAGNTAPLLSLTAPVSGGFFDWGETIGFEMTASDAEDGALGSGIACGDFETRPLLGHDNHAHPLEEIASCDGSFVTADGHGEDGDKIFYVVEGTYTDNGNGSAGPLTASDIRILQPKRLQAQHFTAMQGIQTENTSDPRGGIQNVGFIDHGEYLMFEPINLTGIGFISFRVASNNTGGQIEVRLDGVDGELVGTVHVPHTGGWQTWTDRTISIPEVTGTHQLFLLFQRFPGNNSLFNVNYMQFHGQGIALSQPLEINGLNATYFDNRDLNGAPVLERVDPQVSFDWDEAAPAEGMPEQRWSARWSGFVEAQNDLRTRFYVQSDEGVRLWIDGELEIDEWNNRSAREFQTSATRLRGGQRYHIQVEYVDNRSADAEVILMWDHLGDKDVIRYDHLFPSMSIVNTEDGSELPNEVTLDAAYPNPFRDQTQIRYELPVPGPVTLDVFDPLGRKVRTLVEGTVEAGTHTVTLNAGDLASGTYVYRLKTEQRTLSRQLVLVK